MTQHAESYLEVSVDLRTEVAWASRPVKFVIKVKTLNPDGEQAFAVVHHVKTPHGGETDRTDSGSSSGLTTYDTWTSDELEVTPLIAGTHSIAVEVYQDGQYIGGGDHSFEAIEP